jgi:hypothetical protein
MNSRIGVIGILSVLHLYVIAADVSMDLAYVSCCYGQRNYRETAFICPSTQLFKKIHPLQYYKAFIFPKQHVRIRTCIIVTVQQTTIFGQTGNSIRNT